MCVCVCVCRQPSGHFIPSVQLWRSRRTRQTFSVTWSIRAKQSEFHHIYRCGTMGDKLTDLMKTDQLLEQHAVKKYPNTVQCPLLSFNESLQSEQTSFGKHGITNIGRQELRGSSHMIIIITAGVQNSEREVSDLWTTSVHLNNTKIHELFIQTSSRAYWTHTCNVVFAPWPNRKGLMVKKTSFLGKFVIRLREKIYITSYFTFGTN